jgi:thiamine-monophosphate kinase
MPKKKARRLSNLGEFGWLRKLLPGLYWPASLNSQLCIGPGDDAGVLRPTPGRVLVATTDAMVEGVHFERAWFPWEWLGEKVLAVNLSDLAAMGDVKPIAALITAAFPGDTPVHCVDKFYQGLESCAQRWKTGLLGGDTVGSRKGWFVSVTVLGEADPRNLIKRSGAKAGDYIVTTGSLGLAAAGLEVLQTGEARKSWTRSLVRAFSQPPPRFDAGHCLGRHHLATSLMDSSDGLAASVRLLAEASGVGAEIRLVDIPMTESLLRWAKRRGKNPWDYVFNGGEDYELIATVRPASWEAVKRRIPGIAHIGQILPRRQGLWVVSQEGRRPLKGYGFSHFSIQ